MYTNTMQIQTLALDVCMNLNWFLFDSSSQYFSNQFYWWEGDWISLRLYWKYEGCFRNITFTDCKHLRVIGTYGLWFLLVKLSHICSDTEVIFCWRPSHISIQGNEKADLLWSRLFTFWNYLQPGKVHRNFYALYL